MSAGDLDGELDMTDLLFIRRKSFPLARTQSGRLRNLQALEIPCRVPVFAKVDISRPSPLDLPMILQLGYIPFHLFPVELDACKIGIVDYGGRVRFDPLAICQLICGFVLIRGMVVLLISSSQRKLGNAGLCLTSSWAGVKFLNCAEVSFITPPKAPTALGRSDLRASLAKTVQAVEGAPCGGLRAAIFKFRINFLLRSASVKGLDFRFSFGFGLALAFFADFGLDLILGFAFGFAVDLVFGIALGAVVFGAAFLAAFVIEVVGAFLAAAVLPVWALGRDTGLVVLYSCCAGRSVSFLVSVFWESCRVSKLL